MLFKDTKTSYLWCALPPSLATGRASQDKNRNDVCHTLHVTQAARFSHGTIKIMELFRAFTQVAPPVRVLSVRVFRGALRWSAQCPLRLGRPGGRPKNQAVGSTSGVPYVEQNRFAVAVLF